MLFWLAWLIRRPIGRCTGRSLICCARRSRPGCWGADVAALPGLPDGAAVLMRRWEALIGDSVRVIASSYVPWAIATAVGLMDIDTGPEVYLTMADMGYRATRLTEEVQARMPTSTEARRLNLRPGVPVFSVQRVNHTAAGRRIEVTVSVMSADRYRLHYEVTEN
jgi:GntR family transcriptional regulator